MSRIGIVVPIRSLFDGKTRLASVLDPMERERLNRAMLSQVIGQVQNVAGDKEVIVISPEQESLQFAHEVNPDITKLQQRHDAPLLIGALHQATEYALAEGLRTLLIVPADLPFVTAADLEHLLRRDAPIVVAPDRHSEGTNALMQRLDVTQGKFNYKFGTRSYHKHMAEAHRLGLDPATAVSFGTWFDLDTPLDLQIAESSGLGKLTRVGVEAVER